MSQLFTNFETQVRQCPDKTAIIEGDTRWSYAKLHNNIIQLADTLKVKGIQPGDRVGLMFMNQKEFLVGLFACRYLDVIAVPINIQMPPKDIQFVMQNAGIRLMLTTEKFSATLKDSAIPTIIFNQTEPSKTKQDTEDIIATVNPEIKPSPELNRQKTDSNKGTLDLLLYTSGTTGNPKGVMLSENNLISNMAGFGKAVSFEPSDKILMALPLFHAYGLIITLHALTQGVTLALVPSFNPRTIVSLVKTEEITILPLVPTFFSFIADQLKRSGAENFSSLKTCISGGASLPATLLKQLEEQANITILEGYGLTETSPVVAVNRLSTGSIPSSVGKPLHNLQIRLVTEDGNVLYSCCDPLPKTQTQPGEIQVKGPNIMRGYYNLPKETAKTIDPDGWLKTGDLGHIDSKGNLYISGGRKKDLIIKAGENISPRQIEDVLYQHPKISEACVFGVPDPRLGEDIFAAFTPREGETIEAHELKAFCKEHLTTFLTPSHFKSYTEMPKNATGKILKKELKEENKNAATLKNKATTSS